MDHFEQSITALKETLRDQEDKVLETKNLINALSEAAGRGVVYHDTKLKADTAIETIRSDTFYGKPLNSSIRRVLEMREAANLGPATVRDIYDTLCSGGYVFPRAKTEKNAMDSLRISLGKSSHTFHKLPNGSYGLLSWYPSVKEPKAAKRGPADNNEQNSAEDASGAVEAPSTSTQNGGA